jgi:hypothetical protein
MYHYYEGSAQPTAFITVRKQRQKQNGKHVYLHDRTEFEIELYNPTTDTIKATIDLNGKPISTSSIVLKPGQRVFLERYLDDDRKFLYETYEVSNTKTNQNAIEDNGLVTVRFFTKMVFQFGNYYPGNYHYLHDTFLYNSGTGNANSATFTTSGLGNTSTGTVNCISVNNSTDTSKIETGRVEKGSKSNQEFVSSNEQFNPIASWYREWKILPYSQMDKTIKDLVVKCACGTKMKDNYKFCPTCGKQKTRTKTEIHYTTDVNLIIDNKRYIMETYRDSLDNFLKRHENKLIYIKIDSLREDSLRAIVID